MSSSSDPTARTSTLAAVAVISAATLAVQVLQTRLFSVMLWHHLTYMVVSIAMLGFGAAGSILTARRAAQAPGSPLPAIARYSASYGLSVLLALVLLRFVDIDCFKLWADKSNLLALVALRAILLGAMPQSRSSTESQ